jgi:hypothetical protein
MPSTGKLAAGYMELHVFCSYCQRPRSTGNHDKCSKARQQEHARRNHENETVSS